MSIGGGYEVISVNGTTATPLARLHYLSTTIDGYQETGAGGYNAEYNDRDFDNLISSIGGQMTHPMSYDWGVLIAQFDFTCQHEFASDAVLVQGNFINDQSGTVFALETETPDKNYFNLGLGLQTVSLAGTSGIIKYGTLLGKEYFSAHTFAVGFRKEF